MSIGSILILAGLVSEILGCLTLSIDAIGIDRVERWMRSLTMFREVYSRQRERPKDSITRPGPHRIMFAGIVAIISGFAALFGSFIAIHPPTWLPYTPTIILIPLAGIVGGILGIAIQFAVVYAVLAIALLLKIAAERSERRTAGVVGFALLFIGFVIQFAGTLNQAITSN